LNLNLSTIFKIKFWNIQFCFSTSNLC
jgi:hypothetical protein